MIRKAVPADMPAIVELAIRALRIERYPTLVLSRERVESAVRECVSSAQHFVWVAEDGGEIVACVGAMAYPGMWFERSEVSCVMFYSERAGAGVPLIRELLRWFHSRMGLKRLTFTLEHDADPRIAKLISRLGFEQSCPVLVLTK